MPYDVIAEPPRVGTIILDQLYVIDDVEDRGGSATISVWRVPPPSLDLQRDERVDGGEELEPARIVSADLGVADKLCVRVRSQLEFS